MAVHDNSSSSELLPQPVRGFLEYFAENPERPEPAVTTWLSGGDGEGGGAAHFAALQFIDGKPWLISGRLGQHHISGLLELHQLSVAPWRHPDGVNAGVLRRIRPARIRAAALADLLMTGTEPFVYFGGQKLSPTKLFSAAEQTAREGIVASAQTPRKRGRPARPDAHYRNIAVEYLDLYGKGETHAPIKAMAAQHAVPWPTMRDWVGRARSLGYLTPGEQGRAGAAPGPRLVCELEEEAEANE